MLKWSKNETLNDDEQEIKKTLDKYWNRILMYKGMLENKYDKIITSCYLLIEYYNKESSEIFLICKHGSTVLDSQVQEEPAMQPG